MLFHYKSSENIATFINRNGTTPKCLKMNIFLCVFDYRYELK